MLTEVDDYVLRAADLMVDAIDNVLSATVVNLSFRIGRLEDAKRAYLKACEAEDRRTDANDSELTRLREYVRLDCVCSCCSEDRQCVAGCTYESDVPEGHERMVAARLAMWGGEYIA